MTHECELDVAVAMTKHFHRVPKPWSFHHHKGNERDGAKRKGSCMFGRFQCQWFDGHQNREFHFRWIPNHYRNQAIREDAIYPLVLQDLEEKPWTPATNSSVDEDAHVGTPSVVINCKVGQRRATQRAAMRLVTRKHMQSPGNDKVHSDDHSLSDTAQGIFDTSSLLERCWTTWCCSKTKIPKTNK